MHDAVLDVPLERVWHEADGTVWASGADASILRRDEAGWQQLPSIAEGTQVDALAALDGVVWVGVGDGQFARLDGDRWSFERIEGGRITALDARDDTLWAATAPRGQDEAGRLHQRRSGQWSEDIQLPLGSAFALTGDATKAWVAASPGEAQEGGWLFETDGESVRLLPILDAAGTRFDHVHAHAGAVWARSALGVIEWLDGEMRSVHPATITSPQIGTDGVVWAIRRVDDDPYPNSWLETGAEGDLVRWDGESWDILTPLGWGVHTVSGPTIDDLWILQHGGLRHWNGASLEDENTPAQLGAIWSPGGGRVVATSWDTLYVRGADGAWTPMAEGRHPAIHGTGPEDWWAVGSSVVQMDQGEILVHELPAASPAVAVFSPSAGQAWIADEDGLLHLHADGAWAASFDSGLWVRSMHGTGPDDVWVAGLPRGRGPGAGPGVWHWDGTSWKAPPPLPFSEKLGGVRLVGDRFFALDGQGIVEQGPSGEVKHHRVHLPLTRLHGADGPGDALWIETDLGLGRWDIPADRP